MIIEGLEGLVKTLNNSQKNFKNETNKTLDLITNKLVAKVKLKTPVDTGVLRRNWQSKRISDTERLVLNSTKYASYVEYGHRTKGGKSFVDGQYMLTKSVKEIEDEIDKEFSIMFENLWK